jgi:hypothetical protein
MKEEEVKQRFLEGMDMFQKGLPQPTDSKQRIESLGWRHAKKAQLDFQLALENVIEAYCEKGNKSP